MAPQNNVTMHFETGVYGMRQAKDGVSATLLDRESGSLGDFDLVIDGMGVHSTLRQHRVHDKAGGKHSSGLVMIHGVVDPESKFSSGLLAKLGQHGSMMGVARGCVRPPIFDALGYLSSTFHCLASPHNVAPHSP
jgi:2-polyprenyl-6-methoxyphenol hydroxylase-like FAD-dependent oxidoreductase